MDQRFIKHNFAKLVLVVICSLMFLQTAFSQTADLESQAREYYRPESWPKLSLPLIPGLKLDDFKLDGFHLKEKRYFSPAKGTNYIWYNEKKHFELWIIVNVCESIEAAQEELFDWLVTGTHALLRKGTLTGQETKIGDISWADPRFSNLAFVRNNVVVIMLGYTDKTSHRQLINGIALTIDNEIQKDTLLGVAERDIKEMAPIIESIALGKSELRVNESTELTVVARDPGGGQLEYGYYATGGNILHTKDGVLYQATVSGTHTITVLAVNPKNLISEKTISVTVTK